MRLRFRFLLSPQMGCMGFSGTIGTITRNSTQTVTNRRGSTSCEQSLRPLALCVPCRQFITVRNSSGGKVMLLNLSALGPGRCTPPLGRHPLWADTPPHPADGHCGGRYASYWNAFLLSFLLLRSAQTFQYYVSFFMCNFKWPCKAGSTVLHASRRLIAGAFIHNEN